MAMEDAGKTLIGDLIEKLKIEISSKFKEQKTALFLSSGQIYGRNWRDLTGKYKIQKNKEVGRIYPINILYGTMLESLINQSLKITGEYDGYKLVINVDVDTIRMNLQGPEMKDGKSYNVSEYTDAMNNMREFVSFSDEEKDELKTVAVETIKEYFGVL